MQPIVNTIDFPAVSYMKTNLTVFCLLAMTSLQAADSSAIVAPREMVANEIFRLDQLIEATQLSLKQQYKLRDQVKSYQQLQANYQNNPEDNELLFQLIKTAYTILESIKTQHLETAFEPEFLSELSVLSKPATKSGIPKP